MRVAVIDSGIGGLAQRHTAAARRFSDGPDGRVTESDATADLLGHGTMVANIILGAAAPIRFFNAQVMTRDRVTTPAAVAAALCWAISHDVELVNLSLGLSADRSVLRDACAAAIAAGAQVIAAAPARGPRVFPAGYPGVIRVSGDARCGPDDISYLDTDRVDFGACPAVAGQEAGSAGGAGASVATAYLSRQVVKTFRPGDNGEMVRETLRSMARWVGPERRG